MKKLFLPVVFVVGLLAIPVFGPIWGGLLVIAVFVGLLFKYRREKWAWCAARILRTLDSYSDGQAVARPGVTLLLSERLVPLNRQWQFALQLQDKGLISLEKLEPRHVPPDITGVIMKITPEGRNWLAERLKRLDIPVAKINEG